MSMFKTTRRRACGLTEEHSSSILWRKLAPFDENEEFPDMPKNGKSLWCKE